MNVLLLSIRALVVMKLFSCCDFTIVFDAEPVEKAMPLQYSKKMPNRWVYFDKGLWGFDDATNEAAIAANKPYVPCFFFVGPNGYSGGVIWVRFDCHGTIYYGKRDGPERAQWKKGGDSSPNDTSCGMDVLGLCNKENGEALIPTGTVWTEEFFRKFGEHIHKVASKSTITCVLMPAGSKAPTEEEWKQHRTAAASD